MHICFQIQKRTHFGNFEGNTRVMQETRKTAFWRADGVVFEFGLEQLLFCAVQNIWNLELKLYEEIGFSSSVCWCLIPSCIKYRI